MTFILSHPKRFLKHQQKLKNPLDHVNPGIIIIMINDISTFLYAIILSLVMHSKQLKSFLFRPRYQLRQQFFSYYLSLVICCAHPPKSVVCFVVNVIVILNKSYTSQQNNVLRTHNKYYQLSKKID